MAASSPTRRKPSRRPRRPGRPRATGGDDLRARLLDTALDCFAAEGIAATTLRRVAVRAQVTPALLHYYFGNKDQLVEALVGERLMPVVAEMRAQLAREGSDSADLVAGFINTMFAAVGRYPWFPPLWAREVLSEGGALRELLITRVAPDVPRLFEQRFRAAQQRGELNPDLDTRLLVVSLIGMSLFLAASAPIWRRIFAADDIDVDALRRHALALLDRGIGAA
jgi:TetR/AcrR family transcriptional regulator